MIVMRGVGWCPMYPPGFDELLKDQLIEVRSGERTSCYGIHGAYPLKPTQQFASQDQAELLKKKGNSFYNRGRLDRGLKAYETALTIIELHPRSDSVITLKVQILSNLTQVVLQTASKDRHFHNKLFEEISMEGADAAIGSQLMVKSLYRCARAFAFLDNDSEQTLTCLQRCEWYDGNNVDVQKLRNELEKERKATVYMSILWLFYLVYRGSLESTI
jgi:hypothetical protein